VSGVATTEMSIDKLSKLKETWQRDQDLQARINESFEAIGFSEEYVLHVASPQHEEALPRKSKQIKDNQWGMIEFDWRAMRLVDCPLLQRLRYIKQLGFTYLTYPSAEHSRFSHSLGVGHVIIKFVEAINKRPTESAAQADTAGLVFVPFSSIPELSADDVIHAALLHDIGHLPFSHVTEKALESQSRLFTCAGKRVEEVALFVNQTLSKKIDFAEILTLLLILSSRFENFYRHFVRAGDQHTDDALLRVASLIVGLPPHPKLTGLPELISSASVDADKVDYVNRDALNCGIPVGVDVARIFLRSGIVRATRDQIKSLHLKDNPASEEYLFVVNSSGLDTIDEIMQARTSLYQRVYFHAVTRTAERLLSVALEANARDVRPDAELKDALKLWSHYDVTILDRLLKSDIDVVIRSNKLRHLVIG
jgi:HD superfamily phosphohydrolase